MEILNNFSMFYCFITFILGAMFMFTTLCIAAMGKDDEPRNKVHFYVARDKNGMLWLYLGKPERRQGAFVNSYSTCGSFVISEYNFKNFGLNENDYKDIKWEDEPLEVFINMED